MTRDTYAKAVIQAAEAAFHRNEIPLCPHQDCDERLSIVRHKTYSTRSLLCPVHGHIYQEQEEYPFGKLDWEGTAKRIASREQEMDSDEEEEEEELDDLSMSDSEED